MNNGPYWNTIENVARRIDNRLLNDMEKARKLAKKPHCVNFRVLDGQVVSRRSKYRPRLQKGSNSRRR